MARERSGAVELLFYALARRERDRVEPLDRLRRLRRGRKRHERWFLGRTDWLDLGLGRRDGTHAVGLVGLGPPVGEQLLDATLAEVPRPREEVGLVLRGEVRRQHREAGEVKRSLPQH